MTLKYTERQTYTPLSILPISPPIKPSTTGEQTIKYSVIANELYSSDMQINAHTLAHNRTCADVTHTHTHKHAHTRTHTHINICTMEICLGFAARDVNKHIR